MKKVLLAGACTFGLLFASSAPSYASENEGFKVQYDISSLEENIIFLDKQIKNMKDGERKQELIKTKESLESYKESITVQEANPEGISTFSANKNVWAAGEGDFVAHANSSSNLPYNMAYIDITLDEVNWGGFDWSGTSYGLWSDPKLESVYEISNTLTFTATGVAVSGNLKGQSFSGAASGSANIIHKKNNTYQAKQTFDAFSSGSTIKAVFTSSSSVLEKANSSRDTTLAQITFYDPSF